MIDKSDRYSLTISFSVQKLNGENYEDIASYAMPDGKNYYKPIGSMVISGLVWKQLLKLVKRIKGV